MSINGTMQAGVTALAANSVALASISNNIANVNTTGYKREMTQFADLVSSASSSRQYAAGGVITNSMRGVSLSGELTPTSSGYDLGIDGQGMFMTTDTANSLSTGGDLLFTRDGSFSPDTEGYLRNSSGLYLQGWSADAAGNIVTSQTDTSLLGPIKVSNIASDPSATTLVTFDTNLDSTTAVSTAAATYDSTAAATALSTYNAATGVGIKPDLTTTLKVSDSLGQSHTIQVALIRLSPDTAGATNGEIKWGYEVYSEDIQDASGNTIATGGLGQISSGTLYFDSNGDIDLTNSTGGLLTGLTIGASTGGTAPKWNSSFSAAGQSINIGVSSGLTSITSNASDSLTSNIQANGTEFSSLSKVEIGEDGIVTAFYANGNSRPLGQVALATFVNANGLQSISGNAYRVSINSGPFTIRIPGEDGAGTISASSLESSTVDLSSEFTNLITTQRAYSAASKIITTADEMLQELISIKR